MVCCGDVGRRRVELDGQALIAPEGDIAPLRDGDAYRVTNTISRPTGSTYGEGVESLSFAFGNPMFGSGFRETNQFPGQGDLC